MDAFEARLQFTNRLSKLGASAQAAKACAQFALKHREFYEDLHSCILEQLASVPMNTRVNLLYFIEILCETGTRQSFDGYLKMIRQDLFPIIETVVPSDGSGAANTGTVRRVLGNLVEKSIISEETSSKIDKMLSEREIEEENSAADEPDHKRRKFDEKIINQRMNEDRERHKRLRENIWAVPVVTHDSTHPEFDQFWETCSDLCEDDYEIMREENEILKASVVY
ncbi:CTD kinase subunit gamma CTK3-domain-containing protein [Peziza echinospora]|nr:CTD kinase subunit gamma CTK3-domain-containing protein [Peziza echinospora]